MSEITTDDGSVPDGVIPGVPREGGPVPATELDFDERQEWLAGLPEEERTAMIEALPVDVRMQWINEEREHLEKAIEGQPTEGADFGADPHETVVTPGAPAPQDRAPEIPAETIRQLVEERLKAERETAEVRRVLEAAHAEINAYYKAFGKLPED